MKNSYYTSAGFDLIDIITAYKLNFCLGNVAKYIFRAGRKTKDALSDLHKAKDYLEYEIKRIEGEKSNDRDLHNEQ